MKRLLAIIAIAALAGLTPWFLNTNVFAQTPTQPEETQTETETESETESERFETARERARDIRASVAERREALCTIIQDRLSKRTTSIERVTDTHLTVYENLLDRFEGLIQNAGDKGYDTAELTEVLTTLTGKVEAFSTASETLKTSLTESGTACADETRYGTLISGGREQIRTVREAARDIRTTFREEAIPALKDYRAWVSDMNSSNDSGSSETEETETTNES